MNNIQFKQTLYFDLIKDQNEYYNEGGADSTPNVMSDAQEYTGVEIARVFYDEFKTQFEIQRGNNPPTNSLSRKFKIIVFALGSTLKTVCTVVVRIFRLAIDYIICVAGHLNDLHFEKLKILNYYNLREFQRAFGYWNCLSDETKGTYEIQASEFHMTCYDLRWARISETLLQNNLIPNAN